MCEVSWSRATFWSNQSVWTRYLSIVNIVPQARLPSLIFSIYSSDTGGNVSRTRASIFRLAPWASCFRANLPSVSHTPPSSRCKHGSHFEVTLDWSCSILSKNIWSHRESSPVFHCPSGQAELEGALAQHVYTMADTSQVLWWDRTDTLGFPPPAAVLSINTGLIPATVVACRIKRENVES